MLQVMLTDYCNQACPYCFAREQLHACDRHELSLENLDTIIGIHRAWGLPLISLVGGEPTLHSRFAEVMSRIAASGCPRIHLFTNGLLLPAKSDCLARLSNVTYLVNLNPPDTYSRRNAENLDYFLRTCAPRSMDASIGTTVYEPDPDLGFLLDYALNYGIDDVRIGLAHPVYCPGGAASNRWLTLAECRACSEAIVAFVERAVEHRVAVSYDCHYPLCMFTSAQLQRLRRAQPGRKPLFSLDCLSQVTVKPDLTLFTCFTCGAIFNTRRLTEFETPAELLAYFGDRFAVFEEAPGYEECESCEAYGRTCCGGCLGQKLCAYPVPPESIERQFGD